jgi:hypothetical protein
MKQWLPMSERPDFMHQPGRQFIFAVGWKQHSGGVWDRRGWGLAWIRPADPFGYRREDIERLMVEQDMDGIEDVTHWMPAVLPPVP